MARTAHLHKLELLCTLAGSSVDLEGLSQHCGVPCFSGAPEFCHAYEIEKKHMLCVMLPVYH